MQRQQGRRRIPGMPLPRECSLVQERGGGGGQSVRILLMLFKHCIVESIVASSAGGFQHLMAAYAGKGAAEKMLRKYVFACGLLRGSEVEAELPRGCD